MVTQNLDELGELLPYPKKDVSSSYTITDHYGDKLVILRDESRFALVQTSINNTKAIILTPREAEISRDFISKYL